MNVNLGVNYCQFEVCFGTKIRFATKIFKNLGEYLLVGDKRMHTALVPQPKNDDLGASASTNKMKI